MMSEYLLVAEKDDGDIYMAQQPTLESAQSALDTLDMGNVAYAGVYKLEIDVDASGATPDGLDV